MIGEADRYIDGAFGLLDGDWEFFTRLTDGVVDGLKDETNGLNVRTKMIVNADSLMRLGENI